MTQLRCEHCDKDLHGRDVFFQDGAARCRDCGSAVGGREVGRLRRASAPPASQRQGGQVELPSSIEVRSQPDASGATALFIRVPWRVQRPQAASQLAYMATFGASYFALQMVLPVSISLAAAGVFVALIWSVRLMNQTHITVSAGTIAIRHSPIPWLSRVLSAPNIEQLYVKRRPLAQKKFDYNLCAQLHDSDEEMIFLRHLSEPSVALYLEQCIEDHLQIVDRRVSGAFDASQLQPMQPPTPPGAVR